MAILAGDTGGGGTSAVPEPGQVASSLLLLALGAAGVATQRQRAKKKQAEAVAPRQARAEPGAAADKALLEQFVALGYIDEIPDDPGQAKAETERENDWNMARACMYGQRYEMALPLLEACYHAQPARTDYAQVLATCQLQLGLLDEADATIARASETFGRTEQADLIKASICEMQSHKVLLKEKIQARDKLAALRESTDARAAVRTREDAAKQAEAERRKAEFDAIEPLDFLIVSGLPRSGTSLMMQILQAGGILPMTDGQRTADEDNPEGYHEWEEIKKLPKDPRILEKAKGKAVKVISALLPSLPGMHRYKILYMVRPVAQVVDSQWAMLARQGKMPKSEKQHLIETQEHHSRHIREVLKKSDRVEMLEIDYPALIANPQPILEQLKEFLGEAFTPGPKVQACVKPALHRQRG